MNNAAQKVIETIRASGGEAYLVGGCVRDLILGRKPNDYDIATNLLPEKVMSIFHKVIPTSIKHLTVTVIENGYPFEVTTYRSDADYSDGRHPDTVIPAKTIEEDLARRDFTINAMATENIFITAGKDPYMGGCDIIEKLIRAVGNPIDRIKEDKLRAIRAIRFATQLNFKIEPKLLKVISGTSLDQISKERIQTELIKILESSDPARGIELLRITNLLKQIMLELLEGYNAEGGVYHDEDIWTHGLGALRASVKLTKNWRLRLAILLHDVGKPKALEELKKGTDEIHFYNHQLVGADITRNIMRRLKFSNGDINYVVNMVKFHMHCCYTLKDVVSKRTVKNLARGIGEENMWDMIILNYCDRAGNLKKDKMSFNVYVSKYSIWERWEEVRKEDSVLKVTDLKVNGHDMVHLGYKGPEIGKILNKMLRSIDDDELRNNTEDLLEMAKCNMSRETVI